MVRPLRSAAAAVILASCVSATAQQSDDIAAALSRGDYATALPLIRPLAEHMWFNLAAAQGHEAAVKNRDTVSKLMDREQVAQAQKLAREWKLTIPPKPSQPR